MYKIKSKEWFLNRTKNPLERSTYMISDYNGTKRVFTVSMFQHCDIIIEKPRFIENNRGKTLVIGGHRFYPGWYEKYVPTTLGRIRQKNGFVLGDISK